MHRLSAVQRSFDDGLAVAGRNDFLAHEMLASQKVANVLRWEEGVSCGTADLTANFDDMTLSPEQADFVAAPLSLHWANDLPGVLIQLHRSLRPDGLLLAALPGPDTLQELRACLLEAESDLTGGAAMRVDSFADIRDVGGLLQRTGFALPVVDQDVITVRYSAFEKLIGDLRSFGVTFHHETCRHNPRLKRAVIERCKTLYAQKFADADGKLRATFQIVWLSGWKPHESQQKPLKRGSAKQRLADALNVKEQKL